MWFSIVYFNGVSEYLEGKLHVDNNNKVHSVSCDCNGVFYPYRWNEKTQHWDECSGMYSVRWIKELAKSSLLIFK